MAESKHSLDVLLCEPAGRKEGKEEREGRKERKETCRTTELQRAAGDAGSAVALIHTAAVKSAVFPCNYHISILIKEDGKPREYRQTSKQNGWIDEMDR